MFSMVRIAAEYVTLSSALGALLLFIAATIIADLWSRPVYPDCVPRVGYGSGLVGSVKNYFLAYARHRDWVHEGYQKYNKKNQAFIVPSGIGRRETLILPRSQTQWLFDLPDHAVSPDEANNDSLYAKWNFLGNAHPQDPFNNHTIHRNLIRSLDGLIPGMQEEVQDTIDRTFGLNTNDWKSVNIWKMWLDIIPQITNRMVLGKELGRNPQVLKNMVNFTESVLVNIFILDFLPRMLRPWLGPIVAIPNWIYYRRSAALTLPVIKQRLEAMRDAQERGVGKLPEDFITWAIRQAHADGNKSELKPSSIMKRTLLVEVASIHTTAMTAQNTLLDIISSAPGVLEALREEAKQVFGEAGGKWTKAALSKLHLIDSAIRESQRHSNFAITLLDHKVVAPGGVSNEKLGWSLPYGSTMAINLQGVYHDPEIHGDPETYQPFRYAQTAEHLEFGEKTGAVSLKKTGMVTTSEEHLVFGHGRHACPGRFFVAHELKMAIAYMVLNYDIKSLPHRPAASVMGNFVLPPFDAAMDVRRRRRTAEIRPTEPDMLKPDSRNKVQLTGAQATMLATLKGREIDAAHERPVLNDIWAGHILSQIDYDIAKLKVDRIQSIAICMRTRTFDRWVSEFLSKHQDTGATVVCLACGLDSRALRLDWGHGVRWIDLDLPDVVELRRKLLPTPDGDYRLVASSVNDTAWLQGIPSDRPTLVVMEGLVMYLTQAEGKSLVQRLVNHFPSGQLALDAVGSLMINLQSWRRDGMLKATETVMPWGFKRPGVLEEVHKQLKLKDVVGFREQDGADELPLPVRGMAWALSNLPVLKNIGWVLRYEF